MVAARALLSAASVTPIPPPPSSPNLNAYAERFVRSIKSECLNKIVLLGKGHLRAVVREYVAHYPEEETIRRWPASSSLKHPDRVFAHYAVALDRLSELLGSVHRC